MSLTYHYYNDVPDEKLRPPRYFRGRAKSRKTILDVVDLLYGRLLPDIDEPVKIPLLLRGE